MTYVKFFQQNSGTANNSLQGLQDAVNAWITKNKPNIKQIVSGNLSVGDHINVPANGGTFNWMYSLMYEASNQLS